MMFSLNTFPTIQERFERFGSVAPNSTTDITDKHELPDLQNSQQDFFIPIQAVGVKNVMFPINITSSIDPNIQTTTATFTMTTDLQQNQKGINMSRLTESLQTYFQEKDLSFLSLKGFTTQLAEKMEQKASNVKVTYPWFYNKKAPVTGLEGTAHASVEQEVHYTNDDHYTYTFSLTGSVASLCPCSKEISTYGAHNQRSHIELQVDIYETAIDLDWKSILLNIIENNASTVLYPVLKRPDEKKVTEQAYENPRFVEDLVRLVALEVYENEFVQAFTVTCTNEESIHQHDAIATITYSKDPR
ncbi:GTP cyclohydrolase FolE2 [Salipaludibacillus sp. HK11]|uniref:GTP cyclohydrolase FolE2 n=1 Tax=Salipaludibacillus sp. HK11 TaxID=3394320 RepID=UPI0039FC1B8A